MAQKTKAGLSETKVTSKHTWSPKEDRRLVSLFHEGYSDTKIADALGVTYNQIIYRRRLLDLHRNVPHPIFDTTYWAVEVPKPDLKPGDMVMLTPKAELRDGAFGVGSDSWNRFLNAFEFLGIEDGAAAKWIFKSTVGYRLTLTLAQLQDYEIKKVNEDAES